MLSWDTKRGHKRTRGHLYVYQIMQYNTSTSVLGMGANRGGDLGGLGGRSPQKIWGGGDRPCIGPPNILRSSVVECAWKHEPSEKLCFSCEEMVIYDI